MEGIITKIISNDYQVTSNEKNYICKARGIFRKERITPLVGDNCIFDEHKHLIIEIKERKTS